jgi:hypothetical protein
MAKDTTKVTGNINTTRTLTSKRTADALLHAFKKQRPVMLWGPPGIGKSEVVASLGNTLKREVIDVRLALWDPTDLKGIPFFNPDSKAMDWAPPIELPQDPNSNAILFFDELPSAVPATQAAAYQLIHNRRVGRYVLPRGVDMVAAGNRESDRGVTYKMPKPLANRFLHIEMAVDFDSWFEWAVDRGVHADVVGYLSFAKQDLMSFDARSPEHAFATPRSWKFVSDLLDDEDDGNINDITLADLVTGAVGDGMCYKFMAHRKVSSRMPNPSDVLDGKIKKIEFKDVSALYSLTVSLCYELKERSAKKNDKWYEAIDNYFYFMNDNFPTELVVMGAKVMLYNYNLSPEPDRMKSFDTFFDKYGKYIVGASTE